MTPREPLFFCAICEQPSAQYKISKTKLSISMIAVTPAIVWYLHQGPEEELPRSEWYKIICFVPSGDVCSGRAAPRRFPPP